MALSEEKKKEIRAEIDGISEYMKNLQRFHEKKLELDEVDKALDEMEKQEEMLENDSQYADLYRQKCIQKFNIELELNSIDREIILYSLKRVSES